MARDFVSARRVIWIGKGVGKSGHFTHGKRDYGFELVHGGEKGGMNLSWSEKEGMDLYWLGKRSLDF